MRQAIFTTQVAELAARASISRLTGQAVARRRSAADAEAWTRGPARIRITHGFVVGDHHSLGCRN